MVVISGHTIKWMMTDNKSEHKCHINADESSLHNTYAHEISNEKIASVWALTYVEHLCLENVWLRSYRCGVPTDFELHSIDIRCELNLGLNTLKWSWSDKKL